MATKEQLEALLAKLDSLPADARDEALKGFARVVDKGAGKAQRTVLDAHRDKIGRVVGDAIALYLSENAIDPATIMPVTTVTKMAEDGKSIATVVAKRGGKGTGKGGTKAPRFLIGHGVKAILLNGKALEKSSESEVLRIIHGAKTGKDVYKAASPHTIATKPENVKRIREMGFVAEFEDGSKRPLADLYTSA